MARELTSEERVAIDTLKQLAANWPSTLALFGDGKLRVMDRAVLARHQEYELAGKMKDWQHEVLLDTIKIDCDGGDPW